MSDIQQKLRSLANAYPEDIFPRLTEDEREGNELLLSAAAAEMGRHFSSVFSEAADRIDELEAQQPVTAETCLPTDDEIDQVIRAFQYVVKHSSRADNRSWAKGCIERWNEYRTALQTGEGD